MKESKCVQFSLLLAACVSPFTGVSAGNLNLTTGSATVISETAVSLQNLSLDEQFYNAVIQLNLDGTYQILSAEKIQIADTAKYEVTFESTWSPQTHPDLYPIGLSHFSGLIGATHQSDFQLWARGNLATPGIERMAETGSKSTLNNEIGIAIDNQSAEFLLSGGGIGSSPGSVSLTFEVTQDYAFVSLVSMLAPSPDWFVGVSALNLIENGQWVDQLEVPLFVYDAGTDSGVNYVSPNSDTLPKAKIDRLEVLPFVVDGEIPALGSFIFRRLFP